MKRKVFIHTAVFEEGRPFKERDIEPDDVSRLCTQSIGKLLERVPAYGHQLHAHVIESVRFFLIPEKNLLTFVSAEIGLGDLL